MTPRSIASTTRRLGQVLLKGSMENFYLRNRATPEKELAKGVDVGRFCELFPPQRIAFASPQSDPFVPVAKYYTDGIYDRRRIYVCEVPEAKVFMPTGLVCTRHYTALEDSGVEHRLQAFGTFGKRKPLTVRKLRGTYSTINYCFAGNFWHWMVDCVPKLHSLARAAGEEFFTLLMPPVTTDFQRETLRYLAPDNCRVRYDIDDTWVETERFLWPSLVSDRCMGLLPSEYYDAIRAPIFRQFGLPSTHTKTERIYVSRAKAGKRRVRNEEALLNCIAKYGFRRVFLEEMTFRQSVELFHKAEIVIGPHGAGLGTQIFSGDISLVVLYATPVPPNYFHSLALGLNQRHHFVRHNEPREDNDFTVDLAALEAVLRHELHLAPQNLAPSATAPA